MKEFIPFGSSAPTGETAEITDLQEAFGDPISVYSTEQAIADGMLFEAGRVFGRRIIFTMSLLEKITENAILVTIAVKGLMQATRFLEPDIAIFELGGVKVYVQDNGAELTFMLPEDY